MTQAPIKIPKTPCLSAIDTSTAKITTWIRPLKSCPLYIAPTPGIIPRIAAVAGFGPPPGGTAKFCAAACQYARLGSPPGRRHARVTENLARRRRSYAGCAECLAAVLAVGLSFHPRMIYASHDVLRSGIATTSVREEPAFSSPPLIASVLAAPSPTEPSMR